MKAKKERLFKAFFFIRGRKGINEKVSREK